jgi:prepilin-type processing-associated H-X9-DG protein
VTTLRGPSGDLLIPFYANYGANELVFKSGRNDTTYERTTVTVAQIGRPADLAIVGDSSFILFPDPRRILNPNANGSDTNWVKDCGPWYHPADRPCADKARHTGGSNVIFADGHSKFRSQGSMAKQADMVAKYPGNNNWWFGLIVDTADPRLQ